MAVIIYFLIFALMFSSIVFFESSSKKIIMWGVIISFTSVFGYLVYFIFYSDKGNAKKHLYIKEKEDAIYKNLVNFKLMEDKPTCNLMNYAKRVYGVNTYKNSSFEKLNNFEEFNNKLLDDLERANKYIIVDTRNFCNSINKEMIVSTLVEKSKIGIPVKIIYSQIKREDKIYLKALKESGARVCKFNKFYYNNGFYKNNKSIICIDGNVCYLYSQYYAKTNTKKPVEYFDKFYRLTGDIVKSIDLEAHLDVTFATRKFYDLETKPTNPNGIEVEYQYIGSSINNSLLDLILKAIIEANNSIYIHVDKFIPSESILRALKLAVKSNIDVKIMISNVNHQNGYYTSRSYVKELARDGVVCYFYDGHINSNYVIIDEQLTMLGTMSFVNQKLLCDLQDVLLINDKKIAKDFVEEFNSSIYNSYKLCNPKRVLFREKFFRKFM